MVELAKEVLAEIKLLEDEIAAKKELVESLYTELGRFTYEKSSADREDKLSGIIGSLDNIYDEIKKKELDILDRKGFRICDNCGETVDKTLLYCGSCGQRMPVELKDTKEGIVCKKCGSVMKAGMNFCTSCGNKLVSNENSDEILSGAKENVAVANEVAVTEVIEADQIEVIEVDRIEVIEPKRCPECNRELKPNAAFCINCGTKVK